MIVGAQKSGTTSLFNYLGQHPDIHTHPQSEMCFFVHGEFKHGYTEGFSKYFGDGNDGKAVLLAKHAMLMYSSEGIKRLHAHNSRANIVAILRNPVKRAYSAYWYARRMGWENIESFEEALDMETQRLNEGWFKWSNCSYLYNGIYYEHINRLLDKFGENNVHIFLLEDLREDPLKVCRIIFSLFDINGHFVPEVTTHHNRSNKARSEFMARVFARFLQPDNRAKLLLRRYLPRAFRYNIRQTVKNINKKGFIPPPMNPETHAMLVDYFRPFNEKLSELTGRDLSHWDIIDTDIINATQKTEKISF
jgi:hypothetical protein